LVASYSCSIVDSTIAFRCITQTCCATPTSYPPFVVHLIRLLLPPLQLLTCVHCTDAPAAAAALHHSSQVCGCSSGATHSSLTSCSSTKRKLAQQAKHSRFFQSHRIRARLFLAMLSVLQSLTACLDRLTAHTLFAEGMSWCKGQHRSLNWFVVPRIAHAPARTLLSSFAC
jgi:hypothetical protein